MNVYIISETLSDGSKVYNIRLPKEDLPAVTLNDAVDLRHKIVEAINKHTNEHAFEAGFDL